MTDIHDVLKQLTAMRDQSIYALVDHRIAKGVYQASEREQKFAELLAIIERTYMKVCEDDKSLQ